MAEKSVEHELKEERKRNLEDIIRVARWEAEMVKKMGWEWFKIRDEWLLESYKSAVEMMKNPRVKRAVVESILVRDRLKTEKPRGIKAKTRDAETGLPYTLCEIVKLKFGMSC